MEISINVDPLALGLWAITFGFYWSLSQRVDLLFEHFAIPPKRPPRDQRGGG